MTISATLAGHGSMMPMTLTMPSHSKALTKTMATAVRNAAIEIVRATFHSWSAASMETMKHATTSAPMANEKDRAHHSVSTMTQAHASATPIKMTEVIS